MTKRKPVGVIASGRLTDSALARIPALCRQIGPVAAGSLRLASRYANALKTGHAARAGELGGCRLVVIQSAAEGLGRTIRQMLASEVDWQGRPVVLLNDELDVTALAELREHGATVCAAALAPSSGAPVLLAEGDASAVRAVREWATGAQVRCVELNAGTKLMYGAGLTAANVLITPVLDAALSCFRAAGLGLPDARRILTQAVDSSMRSHQAHGRKTWPNPAAPARRSAVRAQLGALAGMDGRLETFQRQSLKACLGLYAQPAEWLGEESDYISGDPGSKPGIQ
jgi:hypothetical protein